MPKTNDSPNVELAVRSSSSMSALDELERLLLSDERPEVVDDPEEISREIVLQLLGAQSDEELEQVGQATGWLELEGVPVRIGGFRWRPSAYEQGAPIFLVVQAERLDTAEPVILTTGGMNVIAQLANMARRGTLVGAVRRLVKAEKATAAGYHPLWLETPPEEKTRRQQEAA